jgi:hypothetical protein
MKRPTEHIFVQISFLLASERMCVSVIMSALLLNLSQRWMLQSGLDSGRSSCDMMGVKLVNCINLNRHCPST